MLNLTVESRDMLGKKAKDARAAGFIPAELYGRGMKNTHLSVPRKEFAKVWKQAGENTMISLDLSGKEKYSVMIHDVAVDPLTDEVLNVDFYKVRLDEKIRVRVPLELVGVSPAVKDKGGVLVRAAHDLEVEALPANLPSKLEIDIAKLEDIGQSIYVKDISFGEGVKATAAPETSIVSIVAKLTEEEEAKLAGEVKIEDIKVETEEKKAEREAAKAAEAPAETPEK